MSDIESPNKTIIQEFKKLVNFVQTEIDKFKANKDTKAATANTFRLKQIKNALITITKYPKKITDDTLDEFSQFPGIGKGTIDRIKEIIKTGKLEEISNFKDITNKNKLILEDLESVVGVGRTTALEFLKKGIKSVDDLKHKVELNEIEVNDKILLGLKYYGKFSGNIPRDEITKVYKLLASIIKKINKQYKLNDTNHYIFEICGSYRREKPTSGDMDILISKLGTSMFHNADNTDPTNHLERFINILKNPIKKNGDKPLIVDDITDKNYETKYMGFLKYKDNLVRRIDIRYVPCDVYYSTLLYFTGSTSGYK